MDPRPPSPPSPLTAQPLSFFFHTNLIHIEYFFARALVSHTMQMWVWVCERVRVCKRERERERACVHAWRPVEKGRVLSCYARLATFAGTNLVNERVFLLNYNFSYRRRRGQSLSSTLSQHTSEHRICITCSISLQHSEAVLKKKNFECPDEERRHLRRVKPVL